MKPIRYLILSMKTNEIFIKTWSHNFEENRMKVKKNVYKLNLHVHESGHVYHYTETKVRKGAKIEAVLAI